MQLKKIDKNPINFQFQNLDCQNRFELNMSNNKPTTSQPSTSHPSTSHPSTSHPSTSHPLVVQERSSAQNAATSSRTNRKVLSDDTYDRMARSLFGAAKTCHENKDDNETTKRKILEAYSAELSRVHDELKKKLPSSSRP